MYNSPALQQSCTPTNSYKFPILESLLVTFSISNMDYNLQVRFKLETSQVTILFNDKERAQACKNGCSASQIIKNGDFYAVYLPTPKKLKYIRASDNPNSPGLVLSFADAIAARAWGKLTVIGSVKETEVLIMQKWNRSDLDGRLFYSSAQAS